MKKIAIIGSGISGLSCAYYLSRHHQVSLFEAGDYLGGHTHTVDIEVNGEKSAIDTGFIVFNDRTYPNFIRLLNELRVSYRKTEMSFSVRNDQIDLEYNGNNLNSLFAQRRNVVRPAFWRLLSDIAFFNRDVKKELIHPTRRTIGDYLDLHHFGPLFTDNYLLPMIAAIWSMELRDVRQFPLQFFVRFFDNHGLLDIVNRPQWYTVSGGSRSYIEPMIKPFKEAIRLNSPVIRLERTEGGPRVVGHDFSETFDEVVLACHGDHALGLLEEPTEQEQLILGAFAFSTNEVVLHTDESCLPRRKTAWASWNYLTDSNPDTGATLTYNMNILQGLNKKQTYLVSLNQAVAADKVLGRFTYEHPIFNGAVIDAQQQWQTISGKNHIHYCGSYWFNGFHEDGVRSALQVCRMLGVTP